MRILLDTHIILWSIFAPKKLSRAAAAIIGDEDNTVFASTASIWEIGIKHAARRLGANAMPVSAEEAVNWCKAAGFGFLDIAPRHAIAASRLPPIHGDPFDRMLVAQAASEELTLLTADKRLADYSAPILLT